VEEEAPDSIAAVAGLVELLARLGSVEVVAYDLGLHLLATVGESALGTIGALTALNPVLTHLSLVLELIRSAARAAHIVEVSVGILLGERQHSGLGKAVANAPLLSATLQLSLEFQLAHGQFRKGTVAHHLGRDVFDIHWRLMVHLAWSI
jgi:hypothetical protein